MSSKNAVIITTKITNDFQKNEDRETIFRYLNNELANQNFIIKDLCILDHTNNIYENLGLKIETYIVDCFIFIFSDEIDVIFKVLSKMFKQNLVESRHLTSVYKTSKNCLNPLSFLIPNSSQIFQIHSHANGLNPVCVKINNIYVLPNDFNSIKAVLNNTLLPLFSVDENQVISKKFTVHCSQNGQSAQLDEILNKIKQHVRIVKFCSVNNDNCDQNIILNSSDFVSLTKCVSFFKNAVSSDYIMKEAVDSNFWNRLDRVKNKKYVQEALKIISQCYSKYNPENVFLCFNGGKDCTALLFLSLYILNQKYSTYNQPLLCLYIQSQNSFQEVEDFIDQCSALYNLQLFKIKADIKAGLNDILKQKPNLKACLMGTRRTDPFAQNLHHFEMTDPDWPQIMRVNPVLDWKYSDIWDLLLTCQIPYCKLYDLGYTSLGSTTNTIPNPDLKFKDNTSGVEKHLPAYDLADETKERNGRLRK